jgi:hypothetical protein
MTPAANLMPMMTETEGPYAYNQRQKIIANAESRQRIRSGPRKVAVDPKQDRMVRELDKQYREQYPESAQRYEERKKAQDEKDAKVQEILRAHHEHMIDSQLSGDQPTATKKTRTVKKTRVVTKRRNNKVVANDDVDAIVSNDDDTLSLAEIQAVQVPRRRRRIRGNLQQRMQEEARRAQAQQQQQQQQNGLLEIEQKQNIVAVYPVNEPLAMRDQRAAEATAKKAAAQANEKKKEENPSARWISGNAGSPPPPPKWESRYQNKKRIVMDEDKTRILDRLEDLYGKKYPDSVQRYNERKENERQNADIKTTGARKKRKSVAKWKNRAL